MMKKISVRRAVDKVLGLSYLFDLGFKYKTIGCQRPAISTYYGPAPICISFIKKGVKPTPATPKMSLFWDTHTVYKVYKFTNSIRRQWSR